ncbi:MAG: hypothetical protein Q7O66_13670 [Dehalococcoidia bacterium]|nr:hypothetical protein [Dehalococcoidia bacterium]
MKPAASIQFLARVTVLAALVFAGSLPSNDRVYSEGPDQAAEHGLPAAGVHLGRAERPTAQGTPGKRDGKVEIVLSNLIDELSTAGLGAALATAEKMDLTISGDRIMVVVETEADGVDDTVALVELSGGAVASRSDNLVLAYLPITAIRSIASSSSVIRVRRPLMATGDLAGGSGFQSPTQLLVAPSVFTSEGVRVIGANTWQAAGFDATGVKIGIIGLGFSGYESLRGTELPPAGRMVAQNFRSDANFSATAYGSACAEIVYDVAPGATLYLAGISNDVEFGSAVDWLVANSVSVLSLCVSFLGFNNYDGTGYIANKVNNARTAGVFVVAGTGDFGQRHWDGMFSDSDGDGWHQFTGTTEVNGLYAYVGERISAVLTWDDPWSSSTNDYDLYLYRWGDWSTPTASSDVAQGPGTSPLEVIGYEVSQEGWYALAVWRYSGSARTLDLYSLNHNLDYTVASSSLGSPADAMGAVAVGVFNYSTGTIRAYSSQGPTNDGRVKPELSAPDGVSTASYGSGGLGARWQPLW